MKLNVRKTGHYISACGRFLAVVPVLFVLCMTASAAPSRMRPYTGIGLVVFSQPANAQKQDIQFPLYEEPGLSRVGILNGSGLSGNEWIFGSPGGVSPLIVSARKGDWLRVYYDDAGREAWMNPENRGQFQSWERFLKSQTGYMLPALQPQYYQLRQQPGGMLLGTLPPKQMFKVLKIENSWGMVLTEKSQIGWVRWRDDDERLLFGVNR